MIKGVEPLSFRYTSKLQRLTLDENRIKYLDNFNSDHLANLKSLHIGRNRIVDLSEIENLKLSRLVDLVFSGNAICRKLMYRIALIVKFPDVKKIDEIDISKNELERAHFYFLEQYLARETAAGLLEVPSNSFISNRTNTVLPSIPCNRNSVSKISLIFVDGKSVNKNKSF